MKHYNIKVKLLALFGFITLSLSSCGDWLLIEPKSFVTEDNFWNEKTDVDQMVAGVYCMLQDAEIIERCIVWGELRSDNIQDGKDVADNDDLYRALRENLRANNKYTDWAQFYKTINAAQIVIERAPSVAEKDPTYTPSQVLATQAEMKAIKALCMFYLVRAFKDVPYANHAFQSELDMEPMPAHDGDSIIRTLIAELEECVPQALKKYPADEDTDHNSNVNRITQSAIYAILCDLCLWNGDYQKVVDYAERVYDQKWTDFDKDYKNNVNMESGGKPVVFAWTGDTYSHQNGKHTGYPLYPCYSSSNEYGSSYNAIFGSKMNSFESVFELGYTPSSSGGNYISNGTINKLFGSRSEREQSEGPLYAHENVVTDAVNKMYKVYDHQYDLRYYTNTSADEQWSKGYPAKYVCNEIDVKAQSSSTIPWVATYSGGSRSDRNWIFYRLTDVMLMQAEALVELAGENLKETDDEGNTVIDDNLNRAFSIVWAINRRSLMTPNYATPDSKTTGLVLKQDKYQTKEAMRELVQAERRRELMFEGKRWFDLLRICHRNNNSTDYIKKNVPAKGNSTGVILFVSYDALFWPYNKTELKSNTALKQKPFYGASDGEDKNYESSLKK